MLLFQRSFEREPFGNELQRVDERASALLTSRALKHGLIKSFLSGMRTAAILVGLTHRVEVSRNLILPFARHAATLPIRNRVGQRAGLIIL